MAQSTYKMTRAVFWLTLAVSVTLIVVGFVLPPSGEVDGSVLTAVGELLAFAALAIGYQALRDGREFKFEHGDTTVTISEDSQE